MKQNSTDTRELSESCGATLSNWSIGIDNEDHEAQSQEKGSKVGPIREFAQDLVTIGKHPVYVLSVLGSTMYVGRLQNLLFCLLVTSSILEGETCGCSLFYGSIKHGDASLDALCIKMIHDKGLLEM